VDVANTTDEEGVTTQHIDGLQRRLYVPQSRSAIDRRNFSSPIRFNRMLPVFGSYDWAITVSSRAIIIVGQNLHVVQPCNLAEHTFVAIHAYTLVNKHTCGHVLLAFLFAAVHFEVYPRQRRARQATVTATPLPGHADT
jgi:hypothetical protein